MEEYAVSYNKLVQRKASTSILFHAWQVMEDHGLNNTPPMCGLDEWIRFMPCQYIHRVQSSLQRM